jgi:hypothetical protein
MDTEEAPTDKDGSNGCDTWGRGNPVWLEEISGAPSQSAPLWRTRLGPVSHSDSP